MNSNTKEKEELIPYRTRDENGRLLIVKLPENIFHQLRALFGNLTKSQILTFINKLLSRSMAWDSLAVDELKKIVKEENIPTIVVDKNELRKLEITARRMESQFKKWGIVYQGKLHVPCDSNLTVEQLKRLRRDFPKTQLAIIRTSEEQPSPEEISVSELKIVYFDE